MDIISTILAGITILMGLCIVVFNYGFRLGRRNVLAQQRAEELVALCDRPKNKKLVEMYESPFPACPRCYKGYDVKGRCDCDRREFPARDSGA